VGGPPQPGQGRALVPVVRRIWAEIERKTFGGLSEQERQGLVDALARVKAHLPDGNAAFGR